MVPFGEHLGADEQARAAVVDLVEFRFEAALVAGGVAVDAGDGGVGQPLLQCLFDAFGAAADGAQVGAATGGALARHGALAAAVVAAELAFLLV